MREHVTVEQAVVDVGPGPWWVAHEHPERLPDEWTIWDWKCRGCEVHLRAAAIRNPDVVGATIGPVDSRKRWSLAEVVARVDAWQAGR